MSQFSEFSQAAVDYNSTIIGALELSEKRWVLAVQLAGVDRHSRHVLDACGERLASFVERLKARCGSSGRKIARVRPLDLLRVGRVEDAIAAAERNGGHGAY